LTASQKVEKAPLLSFPRTRLRRAGVGIQSF